MEIKDGGILIIAAPRVGGTNLMKSIGSAYNKETCFEPDLINKSLTFDSSNNVVKIIPFWFSHLDIDYEDIYKKILDESKKFKTIILLDRKNKQEQIESLYVLKMYYGTNVRVKWKDEFIDKNSNEYNICKRYINAFINVLQRLSNDLNLPIDYYEDVYKNKSLINKNIKLDLEYFKPKYKLRQEIKPKRLV